MKSMISCNPEHLVKVSTHPIYGIVEYYGRICIQEQWYQYDRLQDRLIRSSESQQQEDFFHATAQ